MFKKILFLLLAICFMVTGCNYKAYTVSATNSQSNSITKTIKNEDNSSSASNKTIKKQNYIRSFSEKVSGNSPELRFVIYGYSNDDYHCHANKIEIFNQNGTVLQEIDFEDTDLFLKDNDTLGFRLTDLNFDGYKDIMLICECTGAQGNFCYDCWLWDPAANKYIENKSFRDITNPAIDNKNKTILSICANSAMSHTWSMYAFIDKEFVLTRDLTIESTKNYTPQNKEYHVTERTLNNDTKTMRIIANFIANEQDSRIQYYYRGSSVWFLDSNKWYLSDYGMGIGAIASETYTSLTGMRPLSSSETENGN